MPVAETTGINRLLARITAGAGMPASVMELIFFLSRGLPSIFLIFVAAKSKNQNKNFLYLIHNINHE